MSPVVQGMTKRQVKKALGRPHVKMDDKSFFGSYTTVTRIGRRRKTEAWLYTGVPHGYDTYIMFEGRRVTIVQTVAASR